MNKRAIIAIILAVVLTASATAGIMVLAVFPVISTEETGDGLIVEQVTNDQEDDTSSFIKVDQDDYDYLMSLYDKYSELEALEEFIRENYYLDVEDVDFSSAIKKGLFEALDDPYSLYYTPEEYKAYTEAASGTYEGIGVVVAPGDDGVITVVSPIDDSPGFKAGLQTDDKILKVDGVEYSADELDQAVMNIRGPADTTVVLTIRRDEEVMDIPVIRGEINLEAASSEVLDDHIGLLRLVSFDEDAAADFNEQLDSLLAQDIDSLIIDLRNNGGGYLSQCLLIADRLMGEGVIVKTKDNQGNVEVEYSDADALGLPIVVLVNGGSASASEILTGALKDNDEGTIIGTTTFGKGLVQTMLPLPKYGNSGFKLTIKQYFTPDDYYIHGIGIEPDITIEDDETTDVDEVIEKAKAVLLN